MCDLSVIDLRHWDRNKRTYDCLVYGDQVTHKYSVNCRWWTWCRPWIYCFPIHSDTVERHTRVWSIFVTQHAHDTPKALLQGHLPSNWLFNLGLTPPCYWSLTKDCRSKQLMWPSSFYLWKSSPPTSLHVFTVYDNTYILFPGLCSFQINVVILWRISPSDCHLGLWMKI